MLSYKIETLSRSPGCVFAGTFTPPIDWLPLCAYSAAARIFDNVQERVSIASCVSCQLTRWQLRVHSNAAVVFTAEDNQNQQNTDKIMLHIFFQAQFK